MSDPNHCPDDDILRRIALGSLEGDAMESLLQHVAACPLCADRLDRLTAHDPFVDRLPAMANVGPLIPQEEEAVWQPVQRRLADTAQLYAQAQEPLDFLEPPRQAGELGWLGRFRILDLLGQGGMGLVFRAEDGKTGQPVALKLLRPSLRDRPEAAARFLREAHATAEVQSDSIVPVLEVGEAGGIPYLVMPSLRGQTLAERLDQVDLVPVAEAVQIARQAAEGLVAVHAAGLVHRDLKPSNLWLEEPSGRVLLLDFGLALRPEIDQRLTSTGQILGTPCYMAPEQVRGEPPHTAADLFSLGCILYELLTDLRPFAGRDVLATLTALANETPADPRRARPEVPAGLAHLVLQLLRKDPSRRPPSARQVAGRLAALEQSLREKQAPAPQVQGRTGRVVRFLLGGLILFGLLVLPGIQSATGVVVVRLEGPDLEPLLPEASLRLLGPTGGAGALQPGTHTLGEGPYALATAPDAELEVEPRAFILRRGQTVVLTVRPAPPAPPRWLEPVRSIRAHAKNFSALAFSPDGRAIATALGQDVQLWDPETGELLRAWQVPNLQIISLAFRPDGRQLAGGSNEGFLPLWDLTTGQVQHQLRTPGTWVSGLAYHPDGRRLVSVAYQRLLVWDSQTGRLLDSNLIPDGPNLYRPVIHPEGRFVAAAMQTGPVAVWDLADLKVPRLLSGQTKLSEGTSFRPDGRELAASNHDGSIWVWTFPEGHERLRLTGRWPVHDVAWTADGRRLVCVSSRPDGQYGEVVVWSAVTGRPLYKAAVDAGLDRIARQPGGLLFATSGGDGQLRLWRLPN